MGEWLDKYLAARMEQPAKSGTPRPSDLEPGTLVEWDSPLFGPSSGEVALSPEGGWVVVRTHSVTGNLAFVKLDWGVRRVKD